MSEQSFYDIGTYVCSGPIDDCKQFIKFNGFTKEDVHLILDKETDVASVISKKAGLCGKLGFIEYVTSQ